MSNELETEFPAALCSVDELVRGQARGCEVEVEGRARSIIVYFDGEGISGYWNSCPHNRVRLDWREHDFMDLSGRYLQCAMHGALFEVSNGLCVHGPCYGQHLQPAPVSMNDGKVWLDTDRF